MQDVRRTADMHLSKETVKLHSLTYGDGKMKALKSEVLDIVSRLAAAQAPIPTRSIIGHVMQALPHRFDGIVTLITERASTMPLSTFWAMLEAKEVLLDDAFKKDKAKRAAERAAADKKPHQQKPKKVLTVVSPGEGGKHKGKGPGGSSKPGWLSRAKCHNCGKLGHLARECRAPITPQQKEYLKKRAETREQGSNKKAKVNAASACNEYIGSSTYIPNISSYPLIAQLVGLRYMGFEGHGFDSWPARCKVHPMHKACMGGWGRVRGGPWFESWLARCRGTPAHEVRGWRVPGCRVMEFRLVVL
jgi:hypothetical protein